MLPDRSTLTIQKLAENAKIKKVKCDVLSNFQTLCRGSKSIVPTPFGTKKVFHYCWFNYFRLQSVFVLRLSLSLLVLQCVHFVDDDDRIIGVATLVFCAITFSLE